MKDRAQRRKHTRRIIRQRMKLFELWGLEDSLEMHQRNRLSKIDFDLDKRHTKPNTISTQRKIDKMNDLDENI